MSYLVYPIKDFFRCKKRNRLKTLDEYYFIKGASSELGHAKLTQILLEDREKERYRLKARKIMAFLLITVFAEAAGLLALSRKRSNLHTNKNNNIQNDDIAMNQSMLDFPGIAIIKSYSTSVFGSLVHYKETYTVGNNTNSSIALPYIQRHECGCRPRQHLLPWGTRLPHKKIPPSLTRLDQVF